MKDDDQIERLEGLRKDAERAAQIREHAMAGKLEKCPKCQKVALSWNSHGQSGEGCWECLACGNVYSTEYSLLAAECNARNEGKYKDSQTLSE